DRSWHGPVHHVSLDDSARSGYLPSDEYGSAVLMESVHRQMIPESAADWLVQQHYGLMMRLRLPPGPIYVSYLRTQRPRMPSGWLAGGGQSCRGVPGPRVSESASGP